MSGYVRCSPLTSYGSQEHIRDARHRDVLPHRVHALWQGWQLAGHAPIPDARRGALTVTEPAAGLAELAEHRREHNPHPYGLLAEPRSLQ